MVPTLRLCVLYSSQNKRQILPPEHKASWAPDLVWMFWGGKKSFHAARIRTPDHPAHILATIQTTLITTGTDETISWTCVKFTMTFKSSHLLQLIFQNQRYRQPALVWTQWCTHMVYIHTPGVKNTNCLGIWQLLATHHLWRGMGRTKK
jgi:hypothetical protein